MVDKIKKQDSNWHGLGIEAIFSKFKTNKNGLSENEASKRAYKFGLNKLPEEKPLSGIKLFLSQFKSPLVYILVIAGIVTLILQHWADSIIIFAAVFVNAGVGYFQEGKASRILTKLKHIVKDRAVVLRAGKLKEIPQSRIIPGDVIVLKAGDKVPADARLFETSSLKVNEAALTGEWLATEKKIKTLAVGIPLADRNNMVYMGTVVEEGRGQAVVVETGLDTEFGKIALSIREVEEEKTPYQKKIARFSKILGIIIGFLCLGIFIGGVITEKDIIEMFVTAVAVAVAAVPEGLPIAITVILALGMERISKKKGLVRKLIATETLGSTSLIATDKTGTLTEAKMQVAAVLTGTKELLSDGEKYSERIDKDGFGSHILALKIATLCTDAFVENPEESMKKWIIRGNPTEKALLLAGMQAGLSKKKLEKDQPRIDELPFDPVYKYSSTLHKLNQTSDILHIVGAPEIILGMSKYFEVDGKQDSISSKKRRELKKKYEELDAKGLRVLAAGYKKIKRDSLFKRVQELKKGEISDGITRQKIYEESLKEIVFVGFIALKDPLRKEAKEAIQLCRQAGMRPIIITGDHRLTAKAIAEEVGFLVKEKNIIEGKDLEKMNDREFMKRLNDFEIYARVEPRQKLRIVQAWQKKGRVVAMTGDGVNDAPALKQADIGVALGSGTDVAKEASDLVLLTDNFSIIIAAIEEGRAIIDNIRKVITFLLADAFTEVVLIGASIIARLPLPILPVQILWVNLIEDSLPAVALGFEPKEKDVMNRGPEDSRSPLLTKEMKIIIFAIGFLANFILLGLFIWLLGKDLPLAEVRTIIFAALTIDSIFYVFSCKNLRKNLWQINIFSNLFLVFSWFFAVAMLLLAIYVPIFQRLLKTVSLNLFDWGLILALGLINLVLIEITKWLFVKKIEVDKRR